MNRPFVILIMMCLTTVLNSQNKVGCISGNCSNGRGSYIFASGAKYSGDFARMMPHGKGMMTMRDGSVYQGDFAKGQKSGKGKLTSSKGDVYVGEFKNDLISGTGKMQYTSGDSYTGAWFDGRAHGKGVYKFADGDYYDGGFDHGEFSGQGIMKRKDGSSYTGSWSHSKKHGDGIAFSEQGKQRKQTYDNNKLIADEAVDINTPNNVEEMSSIDCKETYCDGIKGEYRYGDGSLYVGAFVKGEPEGQGTCFYANGDKYVGGWKNHGPHGQGIMNFTNGNNYVAIWDGGRPKTKIDQISKPPVTTSSTTSKPKVIDPGTTKIYALIVGIASYNHMPSLKYTDDDAYQLFAFLKSPEGGAIPDNQIKILIDDAATKSAISAELQKIADKADQNDVIILYTSGHGLDGSFIPSDFNGYENHLSYDYILKTLNGSAAKHKLFVADACHSGSMAIAAKSPMDISLKQFYNAYNTIQGGTAIIMSSKKEEVSLEHGGLRQGVFSHFFIKGLKGDADINKDKIINVDEIYSFVSREVKSYTANGQNPQIMGDYDKNMPLAMIR